MPLRPDYKPAAPFILRCPPFKLKSSSEINPTLAQGASLHFLALLSPPLAIRLTYTLGNRQKSPPRIRKSVLNHRPGDMGHGPIALRIPPDILNECFSYLVASRGRAEWRTHTRDCFVFSHVCRRWRNAALRAASLWCRPLLPFNDCHADCTKAMIDRSRSLPLDIEIHADRSKPATALALKHMDRARSLTVRETQSHFAPLFLNFLDGSATQVQHLHIYLKRFSKMPRSGIAAAAACLRTMHLHECLPAMGCLGDMGVMDRLTDLSIVMRSDSGRDMTAIALLQKAPNLVHLELCDAFKFDERTAAALRDPKVSLPKLRTFNFRGKIKELSMFFDYVELPEGIRTCLEYREDTKMIETTYLPIHMEFLRTLSTRYAAGRTTIIYVTSNKAVWECFDGENIGLRPSVRVILREARDRSPSRWSRILEKYPIFPWQTLRSVTLNIDWSDIHWNKQLALSWIQGLARLPQLHAITIDGSRFTLMYFVPLFMEIACKKNPFPALQSISFPSLDVLHHYGAETIAQILTNALEKWKGLPLKILRIATSERSHDWEKSLSHLVEYLVITELN
jgi:hypothetical protein